jgi:hypothetical protein
VQAVAIRLDRKIQAICGSFGEPVLAAAAGPSNWVVSFDLVAESEALASGKG